MRSVFLAVMAAALASAQPLHAATCTGKDDCKACKNCTACKHCNSKKGNLCGVCKHHPVEVEKPKKST